jgi:2-polyprenyl-3-methyl-5-hydroxy-6-metoxy-1,4-benzoquinol methylase
MRWIYELGYRYHKMPYDNGPDQQLVELVEIGRISPCRAIDLGCGTGRNTLFLAQRGFDATGVDFASSAIMKARQKAEATGLKADFVVDDLTNLTNVSGTFDFLVDAGVIDSLNPKSRDRYLQNVLTLTHPGSQFFLSRWEWTLSWWERLLLSPMSHFGAIMEPGEIERRFGEHFKIERIFLETNPRHGLIAIMTGKQKPHVFVVYLMTRNTEKTM